MLSDRHAHIVSHILSQDRVPALWIAQVRIVTQLLDKWAGDAEAAAVGTSLHDGPKARGPLPRPMSRTTRLSGCPPARVRRVAIIRSPTPQLFPVIGEFTLLASRPTNTPRATYTPFSMRECACQPLHPMIARANVLGQMSSYLQAALANASAAGASRVQFADHYSALAYARDGVSAQLSRHGFPGSFVGCHNVGAGACKAACTSSLGTRIELERSHRVPPLSATERKFAAARADNFCDCTHSAMNPYRVGLLASVLADSVGRGLARR